MLWWKLLRPEFWLVCLIPFYVGWVVAAREPVPHAALWVDWWGEVWDGGVTAAETWRTLAGWAWASQHFLLGAFALGPLIWGATLLYNDWCDLRPDRANPRKAASPLVNRWIPARAAHVVSWLLATAGLAVAALVGATFLVLLGACLALSWAYSAPPLRLKGRAGGDVAVNAVGIGLLATLAGWSLERPLLDFPWPFVAQGVLVSVAVYIPSTMVDHAWDKAAGIDSFAVHFGLRASYRIGFAVWVAANVGSVVFAAFNYVIPRGMLPVIVPFDLVMILQYRSLIGDYEDVGSIVKGIFLLGPTLGLVNLLWVAAYTGLWDV